MALHRAHAELAVLIKFPTHLVERFYMVRAVPILINRAARFLGCRIFFRAFMGEKVVRKVKSCYGPMGFRGSGSCTGRC